MNDMYTRAPHRRLSADMADAAALLIDFDNVTMGIRSNLGQELRNFLDSDIIRGKVAVQRAYADWRRYPQYIVPLSESSVDLIFAPAYGSSKKNATDIRLAIDALELVFTRPEIGTFILLSGDSDFSSLVLKLKEYGKYVIGVGLQESTSDILVQNCDEYYSYNRLSGLTSADEIQTEKHDPWELTSRAVARMAERGDVMRSDRLKQVMLEMDPGFDEKTAGFSRFNRFLSEAAKRNRIVLQKRENGQYDVGLPSGAVSASAAGGDSVSSGGEAAAARSRGRRGRRGGRGRAAAPKAPEERAPSKAGKPSAKKTDASAAAVAGAYEALKRAVAELSPDGAPVRDSMAKRKLLQYDAAFDEGVFGFSKFSLFLRAAHDAGVVRMSRHEDGNHYLTVAAAPAAPAGKAESAPDASSDEPGGRSRLSAAARAARKTLDRFRLGPAARGETASPSKPVSRREAAPPSKPASRSGPASRSKPAPRQEPAPRRAQASRATGADAPGQRKKPARQRKAEPPRPERGGKDKSGARGTKTTAKGRADRGRPDRRGGSSAERRGQPTASERRERAAGPNREKATPKKEPAASAPKREPETRDSQPSAREKTPSRRTLGRYRSGSRGRTAAPSAAKKAGAPRIGPVADEEPTRGEAKKEAKREDAPTRDKPQARKTGGARKPAGGTAKPAATPAAKPAGGPIGHMVRNYAGVGKRTAEVLFDHFGDRVFDVIDSEPARLTEVLSEGRAKVVREARRAELES